MKPDSQGNQTMNIAGKTALVTGAASGIGLGTARAFAARGTHVALLDVEKSALEAAALEPPMRSASSATWPIMTP